MNKKYGIINKIIIVILLFLSVSLSVLCLYLYQMVDFKEIDAPDDKPEEEMIKVEPYTCYEGVTTFTVEDCGCLLTKSKQVVRLKGDSQGVKNFNQKLENLMAIYSGHEEAKNKLVYSCRASDDELEMAYDFQYDSIMLENRYIALRIKINVNNNDDIDKIFYFDTILDKELDLEEFTWDLKNKYGKAPSVCDNNDCAMNSYKLIK